MMTRDEFRDAVFARDRNNCVNCGSDAQDAHHLIERRLFTDGGYHPDNGVSLCGDCHILAEKTLLTPDHLRDAAGIRRVHLPSHLYADQQYDKWGNPVIALDQGLRLRGELFYDESVQKVLSEGGVLHLFRHWVKYPRTHHLPWSPGMHDDDRIIESMARLESAEEVVATLKMDGENTTMYPDRVHARSINSSDHISRHWVKGLWSRIAHDIPDGWRVCGENLWAQHSIPYDNLMDYFLAFSVWNEHNVCLSWDDTMEWVELLGLQHVQPFFRGPLSGVQKAFEAGPGRDLERCEGYVVRVADEFSYDGFRRCVAKWVRPGHVQTTKHWMHGQPTVMNSKIDNCLKVVKCEGV